VDQHEQNPIPDQRVKHLEMVQAVIARLGNDGFLVKGWAVTTSSIFLGFAVNAKAESLALVSLVPTVFFWGLDTYYLRAERLFRVFYERVRVAGPGYAPFGMDATSQTFLDTLKNGPQGDTGSYWKTAWRPTLRYLYLGLVAASVLVAVIIFQWDPITSSPRAGSP
jgi:hypothetical protein